MHKQLGLHRAFNHQKEHPNGVLFLVPLTGLEPVQYRYRGILSPLCLPIPPQRLKQLLWYHTFRIPSSVTTGRDSGKKRGDIPG